MVEIDIQSEIGRWAGIIPEKALLAGEHALQRVESEIRDGATVYPSRSRIFAALWHTQPEDVKVVIVGQDPYHGKGQANGLAFSVAPNCPLPPSLRNIFKELMVDIGCKLPRTGVLTPWADQGVLLLNSVLTVEAGHPNSHAHYGWRDFTSGVYRACASLPQPVVFITWGAQARTDLAGLLLSQKENKRHIWSSHPSPLGCYKVTATVPAFIGSRPFSTANRLLQQMGSAPVDWRLD